MSDDQCDATTNTGFDLLNCDLARGHDGPHQCAGYSWPNVQPFQAKQNYSSAALAGAKFEDLFLDLFRRIEQLEQRSASAEMLAEQARRIDELEKRLDTLSRQTGQPSPMSVRSTITNHVDRALADLGSGLVSRMAEQHAQISAKLDAMWQVLGAMAPVIDSPAEPATHVEPGLDYQTERVSGSPAAVRCPTRFREGQCMGYAGHEGECSSIPGDGSQMEDAGEFDVCAVSQRYAAAGRGEVQDCHLPEGHDGMHQDAAGHPFKA